MSNELDYDAASVPVRQDLIDAHRRAWKRLALPGTWWDAPTRIAIAAETRNAPGCASCRARREALSPNSVTTPHETLDELPSALIEVIHRVRTDAGRLTRNFYDSALENGISDGEYVETIAIIATVIAIDSFAEALGLPPRALPEAMPGTPSRQRPAGAKTDLAWVPTVAPEDVTEAEAGMYEGLAGANIHRALSLVPDEVVGFFDLDSVQYLPDAVLREFGTEYRDLTHAQIEFLAARVSVINQCVY